MRVVRTGNLFFSFGTFIHSSADGTTWAQRTRNHNDIVWTGERYVAVGNSGATGVSTNGTGTAHRPLSRRAPDQAGLAACHHAR